MQLQRVIRTIDAHAGGGQGKVRAVIPRSAAAPPSLAEDDHDPEDRHDHPPDPETGGAAALGEMRRVSRGGVLINDLVRGRISYLGAWARSRAFTRNPINRHDAPRSARRAYTRGELADLAARAGLAPVACHGFFGYRVGMVAVDGRTAPAPEQQRPATGRGDRDG